MPTEITGPTPRSAPTEAAAAAVRLRQLLAHLRRAIQRHVTLECLSWAVVVAVLLAGGSFALDYLLKLTTPQRALLLAAGAAILGSILLRFLWRPLRRRMTDEDLALVLEGHFPQLEDRLITTLQLSAKPEGRRAEVSTELLDLVAREAVERADRLSVTEPLNRRRLRQRLINSGIALGLFALAWLAAPNWMAIWLRRNVLLQPVEWPHNTYLAVLGFNDHTLRVGRGADVDVIVKASGRRIPPSVRFDLQFATSGRLREVVERGEAEQFSKKFFNVIEPFSFTVAGGDYQSDEYRVEVVDPPVLSDLEFKCEYPAYTGLEPKTFGGGEGGLDAVVGTRVTVRAATNKKLRSGKLLLNGQPIAELKIHGGTNLEARWLLKDTQKDSGMLRFVLTDADGFTSDSYSFPVTTLPDRAPVVRLQVKGLSDRITPNARVPLEIEASDDYGVSQTLLVFGLKDKEDTKSLGLTNAPANRRQFTYSYPWEVEPLGLKPGEALAFHAEALDFAEGKGASSAMTLRVVKREELLDDLRRQQKLYSQELDRLIKRQRETTAATKLSRDRLQAEPSRPVAEERHALQEVIANERDVGNALQNLSEQIARITTEMENNRLGDQSEYDHWRGKVVGPLADVSKQILGSVVTRQSESAATANAPAAVEKLAATIAEQDAVETRLEQIRGEMSVYAEWNIIVETLRRILGEAKATQKGIDEEYIKRIRAILGAPNP
jgi:hypothetical protein